MTSQFLWIFMIFLSGLYIVKDKHSLYSRSHNPDSHFNDDLLLIGSRYNHCEKSEPSPKPKSLSYGSSNRCNFSQVSSCLPKIMFILKFSVCKGGLLITISISAMYTSVCLYTIYLLRNSTIQ